MKRPGPLLTLLAGLLLAAFVLSLNATTGTKNTSTGTRKESPPPTASPTPAETTPPPSPSKSPVPDASYAGRTDDDSSAVALTLRDGRAIAYFCDGRAKESWLKGDVKDDGTMKLTGEDGSVLNGTLKEGKRVRGTVDVGGGHHAFTADRAKKPSGPYRATATVRGRQGRRRLDRAAGRPSGRHRHPRRTAFGRPGDRPRNRCGDGRRSAAHGPSRDPLRNP
jgi:hypothetical protein